MSMTFTPPTAISYADTVFDDTFNVQTGAFSAVDSLPATITYSITGGTIVNGRSTLSGIYGTLSVDIATGSYNFTPTDTKIEATTVGAVPDAYTISATNGAETVSALFNVNITQPTGASETTGDDNLLGSVPSVAAKYAGLAGNDTYEVNNTADIVTENANEGNDTINSIVNYTLPAEVENLLLIGNRAITATGNNLANSLTGNDNANTIDGKAGADTMAGGMGNDTYIVDDVGDVITENPNQGTDTVKSSIDYGLGDNVENLELTAGFLKGTGNALNNKITAFAGTFNDTLDGGAGADTLVGGAGNDVYYVDHVGDMITELSNEGKDTVYSTLDYTLGAELEHLVLQGSAIMAKGNDLANSLTGNDKSNTLNGGKGADTMTGGLGDDSYTVDATTDVIVEKAGEGWDVVYSTVDYTLSPDVETLYLQGATGLKGIGNALSNSLFGTTGDDLLNGGAGADLMRGGAGNDTYLVDDIGDTVEETGLSNKDVVQTTVDYALGKYIYQLDGSVAGSTAIALTGNSLNNLIIGNAGDNKLNGAGGTDTLQGGLGNDSYYIYNSSTQLIEKAAEGIDSVFTTVNGYILANEFEDVTLVTGSLVYGNAVDNTVTANDSDNFLVGGKGADSMIGGRGNDTYAVDNIDDHITENTDEGADLIYADLAKGDFFDMTTDAANVENLVMLGANSFSAKGNELGNALWGNNADNTLTAGSGSDLVVGGKGVDTIDLTEITSSTDVLRYYQGDSLANSLSSFDVIYGFQLGIGGTNAGVDALDLPSYQIASNTTVFDGLNVNNIRSHNIINGLITFSSSDTSNIPVLIDSGSLGNLTDVFKYLQANIVDGETVAFSDGSSTFVFQGGASADTVVQLVGVIATGLSNTGLDAGSVALFSSQL